MAGPKLHYLFLMLRYGIYRVLIVRHRESFNGPATAIGHSVRETAIPALSGPMADGTIGKILVNASTVDLKQRPIGLAKIT